MRRKVPLVVRHGTPDCDPRGQDPLVVDALTVDVARAITDREEAGFLHSDGVRKGAVVEKQCILAVGLHPLVLVVSGLVEEVDDRAREDKVSVVLRVVREGRIILAPGVRDVQVGVADQFQHPALRHAHGAGVHLRPVEAEHPRLVRVLDREELLAGGSTIRRWVDPADQLERHEAQLPNLEPIAHLVASVVAKADVETLATDGLHAADVAFLVV
mmetsp:Transcript_9087/g.26109  ORF Transcript_9087/g.26109 Transcript_9087/m.26109 type:complete len:215 (+) Transcript_9087:1324-1968(+)